MIAGISPQDMRPGAPPPHTGGDALEAAFAALTPAQATALQWLVRAGLATRVLIRADVHLASLTAVTMLAIVCA